MRRWTIARRFLLLRNIFQTGTIDGMMRQPQSQVEVRPLCGHNFSFAVQNGGRPAGSCSAIWDTHVLVVWRCCCCAKRCCQRHRRCCWRMNWGTTMTMMKCHEMNYCCHRSYHIPPCLHPCLHPRLHLNPHRPDCARNRLLCHPNPLLGLNPPDSGGARRDPWVIYHHHRLHGGQSKLYHRLSRRNHLAHLVSFVDFKIVNFVCINRYHIFSVAVPLDIFFRIWWLENAEVSGSRRDNAWDSSCSSSMFLPHRPNHRRCFTVLLSQQNTTIKVIVTFIYNSYYTIDIILRTYKVSLTKTNLRT